MTDEPCQARPHEEVLAELMDWNLAKNEREWAAVHEIEKLRLAAEWRPIETIPPNVSRCFVWCPKDVYHMGTRKKAPYGICFGRSVNGHVYGEGMNGDWEFSHWQPLPEPPEETPHG